MVAFSFTDAKKLSQCDAARGRRLAKRGPCGYNRRIYSIRFLCVHGKSKGGRRMQTLQLGKTGLRVSRMGFGGIPIQKVDAARVRELMEDLA